MFDITNVAKKLGITPREVFDKMLQLEELGLIDMRPLGGDWIAIKVHPLEILKNPRRNVEGVVRGYQLSRS